MPDQPCRQSSCGDYVECVFAPDDQSRRRGVGVGTRGCGDRRRAPTSLCRLASAWVDDVMQCAVASAPATADDRRRRHATTVEPYDVAGRSLVTEGILGHPDRPTALGALARHGQVASETDEDATGIHGVARRECGAIRTHALCGCSQIEDYAGRPPEQSTVELDGGPSRGRRPHARNVGEILLHRREVAVVAQCDERASDGWIYKSIRQLRGSQCRREQIGEAFGEEEGVRLRRVHLRDLRVLAEPAGLLIEVGQLAIDRIECAWELVRWPDDHPGRRTQGGPLCSSDTLFVEFSLLPGCARTGWGEHRHHESPDPVAMIRPEVAGLGSPACCAAAETVTPEALVVATGLPRVGPPWTTPAAEVGAPAVVVTAVVPTALECVAAARAPVVAPMPTTSAASDQLDVRRIFRSPSFLIVSGAGGLRPVPPAYLLDRSGSVS